MYLDYQTAPPPRRLGEGDVYRVAMMGLIVYLLASIISLPFMYSFWLGGSQPLANLQVPKIWLADRLCTGVVVPVIDALGPSPRPFSRVYESVVHELAGPYALAMTYLIPLILLLLVLRWRTGMERPYRRLVYIVAALAVIDFCMMLQFSSPPELVMV